MKTMKKIKILFLTFLVLGISSCDEWLDINTDPNSPTEPSIEQLLPTILYDMADDLSNRYGGIGSLCATYTHQQCTRQNYDQYGVIGADYPVTTYWQDLYSGPLMDIRVLNNLAEETDNLIYAGIAKILKGFIYSQMVDMWGDIPYSEATTPGNVNPVFDDDEEIYADLFNLIDEGIADLQNTESENIKVPGSDDLVYGGDVSKWLKMANTLKLKLYNQVRLTSLYNQSAVNALLTGDLIEAGDDFMVPFGNTSAPENRHPAFVDEYIGAQIGLYISPWLFEIMSGLNPRIFNGISDPRIPYYWVNQLTDDDSPENPPEYKNGNFVSIYFGSNGINRDHAGRATFTMVGIYPCGGKYDDGTGGGPLGGSDGTGAAPQRLITYADRLFIETELMQVGNISGSARDKFEEALNAAMEQVDMVVAMVQPNQDVPALSGTDAANDFINDVLQAYDAANADKKLEIIMTQKWIATFGSHIDQYTDYRRTGYPVMFDPNSNNGVQSGGPDGSGSVPTNADRGYPLSLPYDDDELTLNTNAPEQKVLSQARVFWDID